LPHQPVAVWSVKRRRWVCGRCGRRLKFHGTFPRHRRLFERVVEQCLTVVLTRRRRLRARRKLDPPIELRVRTREGWGCVPGR
jgi:hypothetical protein